MQQLGLQQIRRCHPELVSGSLQHFNFSFCAFFKTFTARDTGKFIFHILLIVCLCFWSDLLLAQSKIDAAGKLLLQKQNCNNRLSCLVKVKSGTEKEDFATLGIRIKSTIGNIWSAEATACQFLQLEKDPLVIQMELGGMIIPEYKMDDSSHRASLVNLVQRQQATGIASPYTGKDIIVGIVDIGFQPDHPTFFDTTGTAYRVKRLWDQLDPSMSGPAGHLYGRLYTTENEILSFRDTVEMHGSHVAGIAGGSGYGTAQRQFAGVAYDADLVFVGIKYYNQSYGPSALSDRFVANPSIIDAYDYIFKYADSVGKPCVINLSWGMHTGPHDGTSLFDQAVDMLTGRGKLIVGSAGNNGFSRMHLSHKFILQDTVYSFITDTRRNRDTSENIYFDMWGSPGSEISIALHLYDTLGNRLLSSPYFSSGLGAQASGIVSNGQDSLMWQLELVPAFAGNNSPNITAIVHNSNRALRYAAISVAGQNSEIHAWNSGDPYSYTVGDFLNKVKSLSPLPRFVNGNDQHTVGENGGTGSNTISVGAYAAISEYYNVFGNNVPNFYAKGSQAWFTSKGPRVDGRVKPDIAAPGVDIISAFNRYSYDSTGNQDILGAIVMHGGQKHYYGTSSGTSMAGPHVAGIVALMLQANDSLNPQEALEILRLSAITDDFTGAVPNPVWGWGKINAYKALLLAQSPIGKLELDKPQLILYPNPASDQLQFINIPEGEQDYFITDMSGKTVQSGVVTEGKIALHLDNGLYCVHLNLESGFYRMKFVVVK